MRKLLCYFACKVLAGSGLWNCGTTRKGLIGFPCSHLMIHLELSTFARNLPAHATNLSFVDLIVVSNHFACLAIANSVRFNSTSGQAFQEAASFELLSLLL